MFSKPHIFNKVSVTTEQSSKMTTYSIQATEFPTHSALAGMCGFQKQISKKTFIV